MEYYVNKGKLWETYYALDEANSICHIIEARHSLTRLFEIEGFMMTTCRPDYSNFDTYSIKIIKTYEKVGKKDYEAFKKMVTQYMKEVL